MSRTFSLWTFTRRKEPSWFGDSRHRRFGRPVQGHWHSGKCLDVSGVSTSDGAEVVQHGCSAAANQQLTTS
ncbi:RICIN domain-containing protein [Streptomyces sp. NPDC055051]